MSGLIVVTGASTGIGRAVAERMAGEGFDVLAGVRSPEAGAEIEGKRIRPVIVDVTDPGQVGALASEVGDRPLAGLVNNAGIAVAGPSEFLPLDDWRRQFEVNLFGHVAVTAALIEALRRSRGRVVNIGSVGARVPLPFNAPYAASKAALWAWSDSLRNELRPWQVHVAVVEPGAISTPIWQKISGDAAAARDALPPRALELYGKVLSRIDAIVGEISADAIPPEEVAEVVEHALVSGRPRARYLVGREARRNATAKRVLPFRAFDRMLARRMGLG